MMQPYRHPDYNLTQQDLKLIRDFIEGEAAVKRETTTYLPHPSQIDTKSEEQKIRYREYLGGAEVDGAPDRLLRRLVGKMHIGDAEIVLPEGISYLLDDCDGDGAPLAASMESAIKHVLQTKWHVLVSDYQSEAFDGVLTVSKLEGLKRRANIKQYARENVINWAFKRINGIMRLIYIELLEEGSEIIDGSHVKSCRYVILGLDETGYYQQSYEVIGGQSSEKTEKDYILVGGKSLQWIPVEFIADERIPSGSLPTKLGYMDESCRAALHKYQVSARYKEVQRSLSPTIMSSGWRAGDIDSFKETNGGRDYIATGPLAVNNLPEGVDVKILSASADMSDYQWYFKNADDKVETMSGGGVDGATTMTATQASHIAADQVAVLSSIADCAERSFARALSYCAMFEGLWTPEDVEKNLNQIEIAIKRDFSAQKASVEERKQDLQEYMAGLISKEEFFRRQKVGGVLASEIDDIMAELEETEPTQGVSDATTNQEAVPE